MKSRKAIQKLFEKGNSLSEPPLKLLFAPSENDDPLQAGFTISRKKFKKAVDRNRIKRLLRESWRLQSVDLKERLVENGKKFSVFIIFTGDELPTFALVFEKMQRLIGKLGERTGSVRK